MNASAQIVNLGPDGPSKVVSAVAATLKDSEQPKFLSECSALITEGNACALIRKLVTHSESLIAVEKEETIEGCFMVMFHLLNKLSDPNENLPVLVNEIAEAILNKEDKSALRLRLATNMYNMLPSRTPFQFEVLISIIRYAAKTGSLSMFSSFLANFDSTLKTWKLSVKDQRRIFLLIADVLEKSGDAAQSQSFLMKYLVTYDSAEEGIDSVEVKSAAARAAIGAVKSPISSFTEHHNLLGLLSIQLLRKDKEYAGLFELVRIFNEDKLDAYMQFSKKNMTLIEKYGLNHEECVSNMRLLSLCTLASEHEEIPYSAISATLQVDPDDVENWVVSATQAGLLEARIDQLEQVVLISRCTCRVFDRDQWLSLQTKLRQWKSNVSALLQTIQRSNEMQSQRSAELSKGQILEHVRKPLRQYNTDRD